MRSEQEKHLARISKKECQSQYASMTTITTWAESTSQISCVVTTTQAHFVPNLVAYDVLGARHDGHKRKHVLMMLHRSQPRTSILSLILHSPSIALDLAICLSIYHRVRSLLAGCVAGNDVVMEGVPKTYPKLGGHVGGVTCPCIFLKIATTLLNCMCLR